MNHIIIGCGGIGGWLANGLAKMLTAEDNLILVDKDKFEKHNMDRQIACDVGSNKANALRRHLVDGGARCKVHSVTGYLGEALVEEKLEEYVGNDTTWFCGADNHRARLVTLDAVENTGGLAIICANEYTDAEAYAFKPEWACGPLDPRVYYPDLKTDTTDDPLSPPCTGEILESAPQLALANMSAANYGMWLWYFWTNTAPLINDRDAQMKCTNRVSSSVGRMNSFLLEDHNDNAEDDD